MAKFSCYLVLLLAATVFAQDDNTQSQQSGGDYKQLLTKVSDQNNVPDGMQTLTEAINLLKDYKHSSALDLENKYSAYITGSKTMDPQTSKNIASDVKNKLTDFPKQLEDEFKQINQKMEQARKSYADAQNKLRTNNMFTWAKKLQDKFETVQKDMDATIIAQRKNKPGWSDHLNLKRVAVEELAEMVQDANSYQKVIPGEDIIKKYREMEKMIEKLKESYPKIDEYQAKQTPKKANEDDAYLKSADFNNPLDALKTKIAPIIAKIEELPSFEDFDGFLYVVKQHVNEATNKQVHQHILPTESWLEVNTEARARKRQINPIVQAMTKAALK